MAVVLQVARGLLLHRGRLHDLRVAQVSRLLFELVLHLQLLQLLLNKVLLLQSECGLGGPWLRRLRGPRYDT